MVAIIEIVAKESVDGLESSGLSDFRLSAEEGGQGITQRTGLETIEAGNQDQWEKARGQLLGAKDQHQAGFGEPRYEVMQRLMRVGVPHPRWEAAPLADFLAAPESFIEPVQSERIHIFVEPAPGTYHERLRFKNLSPERVAEVIEGLKALENKHEFIATVLESPKLLYHGNVLVHDQKDCNGGADSMQSSVTAEFVSGDSPPVSRAGVNPEFRIWQEPFLETYKYDFQSSEIRQVLYAAINIIPKLGSIAGYDGPRRCLLPGYYEVGIAESGTSGDVRSFIYDMKNWENL